MADNITVLNSCENLVTLSSGTYTVPESQYTECVISIDDSKLKTYINDNFNFTSCQIDNNFTILKDSLDDLKEKNEVMKNEIKELRRNLAYLNTRVNNLIAEKQLQEKKINS